MKRGRNNNNNNFSKNGGGNFVKGGQNFKKQKTESISFESSREKQIEALVNRKNSHVQEFNSLISEFASHKHFDMALLTFESLLKKKLKPTVVTYASLMNACVRCGEIEKAITYHDEMISEGIQPNEVTYTTLIKG